MTEMDLKSNGERSDGSNISKKDIENFKISIKGQVIVKGEATEEEYKASVMRWNQVYIKQAVSYPVIPSIL